ncbi:MAG: molybdopterin-dependent oxidoreductase [Eggerthellaceae bacterium]|nr:molybdopterin-dependent oxidoreductase [Eggerthellaceae bacterium]
MTKHMLSRRTFLKAGALLSAIAVAPKPGPVQALAAVEPASSSAGEVKRVRSCCRACGKMECGVWVTVEDGRAVKIEGDESAWHSRGNCCSKSQSSLQAAYHPDRLKYPMKRTTAKGEEPGWQRITWEEAFQTIGAKVNETIEKYGGESIFSMIGTSRIWSMSGGNAMTYYFESPNVHYASQICKGPRFVGTRISSYDGMFWLATTESPRVYVQWGGASEISNYDDSCRATVDTASNADTHIIVDPRMTGLGKESDIWCPVRPGTDGAMALAWSNVIIENDLYDDLYVKRWTNGPFLYCADIEPSGFETKAPSSRMFEVKTRLLKESDIKEGGSPKRFMIWDELKEAQGLTGNDCLTFYDVDLGNFEGEEPWTPQTEGKLSEQYAPGAVPGFLPDPVQFMPEKSPALYGSFDVVLKDGSAASVVPVWQMYADRCAEYAPEKAEEITGVSADTIRKAALAFGQRLDPSTGYGNGGIQYMLAIEHSGNAVQNVRCFDALVGITGNFDTPGGNRGGTKGGWGSQFTPGGKMNPNEVTAKILGSEEFPLLYPWLGMFSDARSVLEAIETGKPYGMHLCMLSSGDHMNMVNATYAWEQLKKLDFMFASELWHAPTSQLADILLPVHHWLEVDCVRISQGATGVEGATCRAIEPPADTMWDIDIYTNVVKAMGKEWLSTAESDYPTGEEQLSETTKKAYGMTWPEFRQHFQENGWTDCKEKYPDTWGTYRRYETGQYRTGEPGFWTPTQKQEIWSTVLETYMPESGFELPSYKEPPHSPIVDPELCQEYPFIMTTGRRIPVYFHNEHRQLPWCREQWPVPRTEINPEDAEELGIAQGDWVWIESKWGKVRQVADLYYGIDKGVINCEHQWWLPEFSSATKGFDLVNINCLMDKDAQCPIGGATNIRAVPVKIYKATAENSPNGNPVPCDVDGTEMITSPDDPRLKEWLPTYEGRE